MTTYGQLIREEFRNLAGEVDEKIFFDAGIFVPGVDGIEIPDEEVEEEREKVRRMIIGIIAEGPKKALDCLHRFISRN